MEAAARGGVVVRSYLGWTHVALGTVLVEGRHKPLTHGAQPEGKTHPAGALTRLPNSSGRKKTVLVMHDNV